MSKQISDDIKQFSYEICQKHKVIIRYMETDKDHIHYMIETEPTMSISKIVNLMKSYTYNISYLEKISGLSTKTFLERTYFLDGRICCLQCRKCFRRDAPKIYRKSRVERWRQWVLKAYKYRIYPDSEQRIQIAKTFGCCRFVYNQTLAYRKEIYEKEKKSVSKTDCNNYCNRELKKDYEWLKEIDKFALTNAIYNMDAAYQKFFKEHAGYPKFKSKHDNHKSYTTNFTNGNIAVDFETGKIKLPKLKAVKARLHREYSGQIKSATVSQVSSGKYYVSILVETEHKGLAHTNHNIGIDLGIKDLCITSDGKVYENLKIIKKYEKQLVKLQRQLSHKGKRSKNYYKTKKKIALCHEKIRNMRKDYLHKVSHEIISENQVIVSENLQIKNMVKNHHLAKAISDVSWYELTRQLEYKAKWNGRKYIKIDTFYASSQLCSVCGYQNPDTKDLSVRTWICPKCGAEHDRDINAAKNILTEGLRQIA